ncbi:VanZ family protein [Sabulicella glaciei]|uniref:VanZ family protein n=1 Tax=Sabulicella glaciei TaxID=2984948 RepID=A0ABT3NSY3_9PROT|nr:VanZ family protein [Roseococcus sp. MDT2-1-1]
MAQDFPKDPVELRSSVPFLKAALLAAIAVALILYGSLYPFRFHAAASQADFVTLLLRAWNRPIGGRGDLVANLALYAPLGFFAAACLMAGLARTWALVLATLLGAMLSCSVELAQLYVPGRTSSVWDVCLNAAGCFIGALAAVAGGATFLSAALAHRKRSAEPFAVLLVLAWLGYRLYPYVPAIDLQLYWNSLKPLVLTPTFEPFRSLRLAILWLVAAHLIEVASGRFRPCVIVPAVLVGTLLSGVVIVDRVVTTAELLGVGMALLGWMMLRGSRWHRPVLLTLLLVVVVADRLAPFHFTAAETPFGWTPFLSVFRGHWGRGLQSMLEKSFLYGSLLWLLVRQGLPLLSAAGVEMALLFATSLAQTHIRGRSAEITDTVLAGGLAVVFALLRVRPGGEHAADPGNSVEPAAKPRRMQVRRADAAH